MINLLKNAMKFIVGGKVTVAASFDEMNEKLKICVSDTGKGFKEEDKRELFKMFGKVEQTEAINTEGIGVGLFIVKRIIDSSGGEISVSSEGENKGTTFTFTMNMKKAGPEI